MAQNVENDFSAALRCDRCDQVFLNEGELAYHRFRCRGPPVPVAGFPCAHPDCDVIKASEHNARVHYQKRHESNYKCPVDGCGRIKMLANLMIGHITTRHPEYPLNDINLNDIQTDEVPQGPLARLPTFSLGREMANAQANANLHVNPVRPAVHRPQAPQFPPPTVAEEGDARCPICLTNKAQVVVIPCGHVCLCTDDACVRGIHDRGKCPMCQGNITQMVCTFQC
jgi:hypothetical protein